MLKMRMKANRPLYTELYQCRASRTLGKVISCSCRWLSGFCTSMSKVMMMKRSLANSKANPPRRRRAETRFTMRTIWLK